MIYEAACQLVKPCYGNNTSTVDIDRLIANFTYAMRQSIYLFDRKDEINELMQEILNCFTSATTKDIESGVKKTNIYLLESKIHALEGKLNKYIYFDYASWHSKLTKKVICIIKYIF